MVSSRVLAVVLSCLPSALSVAAAESASPPIIVTAPRPEDDYAGASSGRGPWKRPVLETPASETVVTRAVMDDQMARGVVGVIGNDPSVGENYAPVGYYESLSIRGYTLDNASGFKRDGLTVANESSMPLENKERVEIQKGVAGFEAGPAAPGGTVNYVVKRPTPKPLRVLEFALSERGTRYARADAGGRLGGGTFGYRFNAAREDYHPYVKEAVGSRDFAGMFLDWRPDERTALEFDADWQRKSQLSVPGTQVLGGAALPSGVGPEKMLNNQPWSAPVAITASNVGGRLSREFESGAKAELSVNRNRLRSDDVAAFPFGCSSGPTPLTTFCANGDYDLYDYRSLGEVRAATQAQAVVSGGFDTGPVRHQLLSGVSRFTRTVDLGTPVYDYVGTANINDPAPRVFAPSPNSPGPVFRVQNYSESALFARDAVSMGARWKLIGGARWSSVRDDHFDMTTGAPVSRYARTIISPQLALIFAPRPDSMAYASYSQGLELGGTAPATAANAGQIHDPLISRQYEVGVKREVAERLNVSAAAFHILRPYEYTDADNVFIRKGSDAHSGLEFSASGRASEDVKLIGGATLLHARIQGTGDPGLDGKAPVNVPWLRLQASADYALTRDAGLDATWAYVSAKYAAPDDAVSAPGYHRFDAGARWARPVGRARVLVRLRVENVLNALYWKDTGAAFGDDYLHLGAPRTFKSSVQLEFE